MAKRGEGEQTETPETNVALISQKTLVALLKQDDNYKGQIDGLTGELRETIGNAVEKKHLHKKAYAMLKSLHRMDDVKLADLWPTLLAYMDMAGVTKRIDSVGKLPLEEAEGDADGKVTRLRQRTAPQETHAQAAE